MNESFTITLPDGTVIDPSQMPEPPAPPVKNADGFDRERTAGFGPAPTLGRSLVSPKVPG